MSGLAGRSGEVRCGNEQAHLAQHLGCRRGVRDG